MKKLESIDTLLNKAIKLSKDPKKNASELEKIRNKIISQKETIDAIDINKIKRNLENADLDFNDYSKYKNLLTEKQKYNKKSEVIKNIINRKYNALNTRRKIKKVKLACGIILVGISSFAIGKIVGKNTVKNNNTHSTEIEEETTTEEETFIIDESSEEVDPYWGFGESAIAFEEFDDTESTTEETTTEETTTEDEESVNEYWAFGDGAYAFEDKSIYWGFDNLNTDTVENSIDFFNTASGYIDDMEEMITDSDKREVVKEEAKNKAIKYIDFIFYGEDINGVYFDDLKDDAKAKAYENCQKLVNLVNNYDPEYFDNMGERYSRLKDLVNSTLNSAKEKVKEKVGEDYYDDAGQVKDDTIDSIRDTGKILKNVISDRYTEWKNEGN